MSNIPTPIILTPEQLEKIDSVLRQLEDTTKGKLGNEVSECRNILINAKSAPDWCVANWDYHEFMARNFRHPHEVNPTSPIESEPLPPTQHP